MSFRNRLRAIFLIFITVIIISSCSNKKDDLIFLETFTKNSVTVSIYLSTLPDGTNVLLADFVPEEGLHLYSKDIPRNGVNGLGRPALLELTIQSQMKVAGELSESVAAQIPDFEPKDLLVYPAGNVQLSLPITLPVGKGWVNDEVSVTYMACSDIGCKAPVVDQIISVRIPSQ